MLVTVLAGIATLAIGVAIGCVIQHRNTGYHYEVRDAKEYDSAFGPVRWSYVTESVGIPILDSGTTVLELDGRTIYKADRTFQESTPYAKNVEVDEDRVSWDDGEFRHDLTIKQIENGEDTGPDD